MVWSVFKSIGAVVSGVAASCVVSNIINEFSNVEYNKVETAVFTVGTAVISAAVGYSVANYVRNEIGDIEQLIKEIHNDTEEVAANGGNQSQERA